jgi:hypothetical protein
MGEAMLKRDPNLFNAAVAQAKGNFKNFVTFTDPPAASKETSRISARPTGTPGRAAAEHVARILSGSGRVGGADPFISDGLARVGGFGPGSAAQSLQQQILDASRETARNTRDMAKGDHW